MNETPLNLGQDSQDSPLANPDIDLDIVDLLRTNPDQLDQAVHKDWLARLTPKEAMCYDGMGYYFQVVKAITLKIDKIALLEEEVKQDRNLSFSNLIKLMDRLYEETKSFRGRELNRTQTPQLVQMTKLVRHLGRLKIIAQLHQSDDKRFDRSFMQILQEHMPKDLYELITVGAARESTQKILTGYMQGLDLQGEENVGQKAKFIEALSSLRKCIQKITAGNKAGTKNGNLELSELAEAVDAFTAVEAFRRVSFQDIKPGQVQNLDYMDEIAKLGTFIQSTEGMFIRFGGLKLGSWKKPAKETEREKEMRILNELDDKRALIKEFSLNFIERFPKLTVLDHHMQVRKRKIASYPLFVETVESIDDPELKREYKKLLKQISTILSYLEWVWNMHDMKTTPAGTQIIYPQQMLWAAPFILLEVEDLSTRLNILADELADGSAQNGEVNFDSVKTMRPPKLPTDFQPGPSEPETDHFGKEIDFTAIPVEDIPGSEPPIAGETNARFFPAAGAIYSEGLAEDYNNDSKTFRLSDLQIAAASTQAKVETALEQKPTIPAPAGYSTDQISCKLEHTYELCAKRLNEGLSTVRPALRATRLHSLSVNKEQPNGGGQQMLDTLSYDIHDFIHLLTDDLSQVVYQLVKVLKPEVTRKDVLPKFEEYEEQTAELRRKLHNFIKSLMPVLELVDVQANPRRESDAGQGMLKELVEGLKTVQGRVNQFRAYQEDCLTGQRFHAMLRGAPYETLVRMTNTINAVMKDHIGAIDVATVDLYVLRKEIGRIGIDCRIAMEGINGKLANSRIAAKWVEEVAKLEKLEEKIVENGLTPKKTAEIEREYRSQFAQVFNDLAAICTRDTVYKKKVGLNEKAYFSALVGESQCIKLRSCGDFTPAFFKFQKLMRLIENLVLVCGKNVKPYTDNNYTIREQILTFEYDLRQAAKLSEVLQTLMSLDYADMDAEKLTNVRNVIKSCREALGDLWFRVPEAVENIRSALTGLQNKISDSFWRKSPLDAQELLPVFEAFGTAGKTPLLQQQKEQQD